MHMTKQNIYLGTHFQGAYCLISSHIPLDLQITCVFRSSWMWNAQELARHAVPPQWTLTVTSLGGSWTPCSPVATTLWSFMCSKNCDIYVPWVHTPRTCLFYIGNERHNTAASMPTHSADSQLEARPGIFYTDRSWSVEFLSRCWDNTLPCETQRSFK